MPENPPPRQASDRPPIRGSLRLNVTASNAEVTAGSNFSIFVTIQNPFEVPITVYQTQTHIPIDLIDVNGLRIRQAQAGSSPETPWYQRSWYSLTERLKSRSVHNGVAVAVGTDFQPDVQRELTPITAHFGNLASSEASVVGIQFTFPENPSSEELDQLFGRLLDYKRGLVPVTLQPGDSVVKQFVLRTRRWLFFTPLTHQFEIQVKYSSDGVDHSDTVSYRQLIRSSLKATAIGGVVGAIAGTLLGILTGGDDVEASQLRVMAASALAAVAIVVAFARKSGVQPLISVEDFFGGALIGFSASFIGFEQFIDSFSVGVP